MAGAGPGKERTEEGLLDAAEQAGDLPVDSTPVAVDARLVVVGELRERSRTGDFPAVDAEVDRSTRPMAPLPAIMPPPVPRAALTQAAADASTPKPGEEEWIELADGWEDPDDWERALTDLVRSAISVVRSEKREDDTPVVGLDTQPMPVAPGDTLLHTLGAVWHVAHAASARGGAAALWSVDRIHILVGIHNDQLSIQTPAYPSGIAEPARAVDLLLENVRLLCERGGTIANTTHHPGLLAGMAWKVFCDAVSQIVERRRESPPSWMSEFLEDIDVAWGLWTGGQKPIPWLRREAGLSTTRDWEHLAAFSMQLHRHQAFPSWGPMMMVYTAPEHLLVMVAGGPWRLVFEAPTSHYGRLSRIFARVQRAAGMTDPALDQGDR